MNAMDDARARKSMQEALEKEFAHLHGADPNIPPEATIEEREQALRRRTHYLVDERAPWALCLSGGGIRSATFGLGVLQALASCGLLTRFHYLSTVSGGGYVGSWLSRWIAAEKGDIAKVERALAGGTGSAQAREPEQLSQLRAFSNYLSPVWGLSADFFTLVSIALRNLLLNWCVLLPLIAAALLVPYLYTGLLGSASIATWLNAGLLAAGTLCVLQALGFVVTDLPARRKPPQSGSAPPGSRRFGAYCFAPMLAAAVLFSVSLSWLSPLPITGWYGIPSWVWFAVSGAVVHLVACAGGVLFRTLQGGISPRSGRGWSPFVAFLVVIAGGVAGGALVHLFTQYLPREFALFRSPLFYSSITVPALLLSFWAATSLYVALVRPWSSEDQREWWARSGGWWLRASLCWLAGFTVVAYVPQWLLGLPLLETTSGSLLLAGGGLWGLLTGIAGYVSKNGESISRHARGVANAIGARVLDLAAAAFILGLIVSLCLALAWGLAKMNGEPAPLDHPSLIEPASVLAVKAAARATETAARAAEAATRTALERKDGAKAATAGTGSAGEISPGARSVNQSAQELARLVLEMKADPRELRAITDELIRTGQAVSAAAALVPDSDTASRAEIRQALGAVSGAGANLAERAARAEEPGPARVYASELVRPSWQPLILFATLLALAIAFSRFVGINPFSLHSMYGNRLVRAYFGAARAGQQRNPHWFTGFDNDDNVSMSALANARAQDGRPRLFHVVNLALNIVSASGGRLEWQQRKAASFTVTPLHSGSAVVGQVPSCAYAGPEDQGISLARAMTISGAAASPNMGYHSSPVVAFVMTLFNIRLGWWLPNPAVSDAEKLRRSDPGVKSKWLLLNEALGLTTADESYVYLSDGGHFENLGLYEMVRRRCRRILVVDASADPASDYGDLQDAIRKIRIDLGISIDFEPASFDTARRYRVGKISYRDADASAPDGVLCYLKPALFGDEPLDVRSYAIASRKRDGDAPFPHQSTADQFFDEMQFESYRMLGCHMASRVFGSGEWPQVSAAPEAAWPPVADTRQTKRGADGEPESAFSKIAGSAQQFGQSAVIASAITVGGVIGVSGTVALKDSTVSVRPGGEVSISKQSLQELKEIPLKAELQQAKGGGTTPSDIQPLIDQATQLSERLKSTIEMQKITVDTMQKLGVLVDTIENRVRTIEAAQRKESVPSETTIKNLSNAASKLADAVNALPSAIKAGVDLKPVLESLRTIDDKLLSIGNAIQQVPPRRNIRGIEGGGR